MATKKVHDEELQRGLEKLQQDGVATDEPTPDLIDSIKAHLGKARETDLALVFLLGRIAAPAALETLTGLERTATDKAVQREVRRSFYKL
ncbi:MAG: hypothetical protein E6J89_13345, partial [Deltaproteobacteria bacterium]